MRIMRGDCWSFGSYRAFRFDVLEQISAGAGHPSLQRCHPPGSIDAGRARIWRREQAATLLFEFLSVFEFPILVGKVFCGLSGQARDYCRKATYGNKGIRARRMRCSQQGVGLARSNL